MILPSLIILKRPPVLMVQVIALAIKILLLIYKIIFTTEHTAEATNTGTCANVAITTTATIGTVLF